MISKSATKQECSLLLLLFNIVLKALANAIGQNKRIKNNKYDDWNERTSWLFANNMTIYLENIQTIKTSKRV